MKNILHSVIKKIHISVSLMTCYSELIVQTLVGLIIYYLAKIPVQREEVA